MYQVNQTLIKTSLIMYVALKTHRPRHLKYQTISHVSTELWPEVEFYLLINTTPVSLHCLI